MIIVRADFHGLGDPAWVRRHRHDLDRLVSRSINKGYKLATTEAMTQASRYNNAHLGAPVKSNRYVAFTQRATPRRLAATFALIWRKRLSLGSIVSAKRDTPTGAAFRSRRRGFVRTGAWWDSRGRAWRRATDRDRARSRRVRDFALQTIRIVLPARTIEYLYRRFDYEYDRALHGGLTRLIDRVGRR